MAVANRLPTGGRPAGTDACGPVAAATTLGSPSAVASFSWCNLAFGTQDIPPRDGSSFTPTCRISEGPPTFAD
eukprot:11212404-Lingulodinium_polyedra.AAC.1